MKAGRVFGGMLVQELTVNGRPFLTVTCPIHFLAVSGPREEMLTVICQKCFPGPLDVFGISP